MVSEAVAIAVVPACPGVYPGLNFGKIGLGFTVAMLCVVL
jgi:hypothetical protein